nr:PREDICTED: uncharacterized protein LOC100141557 [Tribolium castaneum]|eukprot:XP_015834339.1 PREDICTED: uncharacterized protein LOC100141557 [Tribolium castaneum]
MEDDSELQNVPPEASKRATSPEETPPAKKVRLSLSGKDFRKLLQTGQTVQALQGFSKYVEDSKQDFIKGYLDAGGSALEILQLVEGESEVSPVLVFDVVNTILLQIGSKLPQFQSAAFDCCRYLLNTYVSLINKMLGLSSNTRERVVALKLLTTIVTFSVVLAKDILLHVNFNPTNIELLSRVSEGKTEVRSAFIHFLTAFLIDGHFPVLSVLLDKKGFMTSIVHGLLYDKVDVVVLVLTAMKNHILENSFVSKTVKMKTFSTPVVRDIVNLYNWKGPAGLIEKKRNHSIIVDDIDKSKVSEAVHSFLLVLCTSHKHGVIFKDPLVGLGRRQNSLMHTVLESLERPWEHSYAGELVIKICKACPDLLRSMWSNLKEFLEPRMTVKWLNAMKFAKTLLDELQPDCIEPIVNNLNVHQIGQIVTILAAPLQLLKTVIPQERTFERASVKYHVMCLCLKMAKSLENYLNRSKAWNIDQEVLKILLSNYIQRNFPDVELILNDWDQKDDDLSLCDYLDTALDLLQTYKSLAPKILNDFSLTFDLKQFLTKCETLENSQRLQVKAVKFFLDLEPALFRPKTDLFETILLLSFEFYYDSRDPIVLEMLTRVLQSTGLFDGYLFEIDFWIDGVLNLKSYDEDVAKFLCSLIRKIDEDSGEFNRKLFELQGANFSPLLLGIDGVSKSMKNYLNFVILNLFHLQVDDASAFVVIVSNFDFLSSDLLEYMNNWSNLVVTDLPKCKGKILEEFHKFSSDFLNQDLEKNFNCDLYPNFKLNLLQCVIFYITNLIKADVLKENQIKNTVKFISGFISDDTFDERYVKTILGNSLLLHNLTLFDSNNFSTQLILNVIKSAKNANIDDYLTHFRRKIVSTISKIFRKSDKYENATLSMEVIETVSLSSEQCRKLLEKFAISVEIKRFFPVACYCLDRMSENDSNSQPLSNETVQKLTQILQILLEEQVTNSHSLSLSLLNYLKVFPHNLEGVESKLFDSLVSTTEFNKDNLSLCEFLLDRKPEIFSNFENNLDVICSKRSFILFLLDVVVQKCDNALLEKIFNKCESYIIKALQKPHKAGQHFQNHYRSVGILIERFMKPDGASQIQKFETCELFHFYLLKKRYDKVDRNEKVLGNIIMTLIHLLMSLLKQKSGSKSVENLTEIGELFNEFLSEIPKEKFDMTSLSSNETFKMFCKLCLKYGLTGDLVLVKILSQLVQLCTVEDEGKLILEMLLSHSHFLDVILSDSHDEIANLWLILCEKWPLFMERSHIPVLLSAYKATNSDKTILHLLKMYEARAEQTQFFDFKPFLWGRAAASHYSVRSDIQKVLWRQPKTADILNNLHVGTIIATINNPQGRNSYDLDYFLPLFIHILSPENPVATYRFTRTGALALALTGLRGDKAQRLATCHILQRFYFHLEAKQTGKDNLLWLRFIEAICKGIVVLEDFKINNFVGIFLSRTALVLAQPTDVMYVPLTQYLSAKDSLDFSGIPELYTFLHSPHVDSREHKTFILEVLRDGLRDDKDFITLLRTMGFKLISELCSSSVCDTQTRLLVLEVFEVCCEAASGVKILCGSLAFLSQIFTLVLRNCEDGGVLVKLLKILLKIVEKSQDRYKNFVVYLNLVMIFGDEKLFKCLVESKGSDVFYHVLNVIVNRFPDFFVKEHYDIILEKTNDKFCKYLDAFGCRYVRESDCSNPANPNYLRLVFFNKLKNKERNQQDTSSSRDVSRLLYAFRCCWCSVMDVKMAREEVQVPLRDKPLKQLNRIAKRPKLDVEFQDLKYSIRDSNAKGGWRTILNSVNGKFRCGEFTAILGPSGAGKSSLLNILAGCVTGGVKGSIKINDRPRDMKIFNKLSSYIMQEDCIQPRLTVKEAMIYAACLKLGAHIEYRDKLAVIHEVIDLLGLEKCVDTLSEHLSGGQRKRLSVALELVNNPPVIFLDEPTTGLDNFAINQCIHLLKKISQLDRTVVCTIHQPPASIFQYFDQVYIVANGYCVYNGAPNQLVPFFNVVGHSCPSNNTPADYMIELIHSQPTLIQSFQAAIQNGKINMKERYQSDKPAKEYTNDGVYNDTTEVVIQKSDIDFATSFNVQFSILLSRMFLQMRRNRLGLYIQFFHHLLSGLIVGGIFYGIGNDAAQTIAIFKYCVCINVFFMYTHVMMPVLLFPLEVSLMKREYFNRWYGLKAYYAAMTVVTLPPLIILGMMFSTIVYFMSHQPLETDRFLGFTLTGLAVALTSQGLGYCIGSIFSITNGSVVGPSVLAPLLALAVYGMGYRASIEPFYKVLMTLTYIRNGVVGICNSLFYERPPLTCGEEEIYCHYARPDILMGDMAIPLMHYRYQLGIICIFMIVFRIVGYFSLKCRLNNDLATKIMFYAKKIIKHKY